jgi:hypothetical protein
VESEELEPWQEAGETWRRLKVHFPTDIATHSTEQTLYFDQKGLLKGSRCSPCSGKYRKLGDLLRAGFLTPVPFQTIAATFPSQSRPRIRQICLPSKRYSGPMKPTTVIHPSRPLVQRRGSGGGRILHPEADVACGGSYTIQDRSILPRLI